MPKVPGSKRKSDEQPRHVPLAEEYAPSGPRKQKAAKRRKVAQEDAYPIIDAKASRRILKIGQDLVEEAELEEAAARPNPAFAFESRDIDVENQEQEIYGGEDEEEAWGSDEDHLQEDDIEPNDNAIFDRFHTSNADSSLDPNNLSFDPPSKSQNADREAETGNGTDLSALILAKIAEHENGQAPSTFQDDGISFNSEAPQLHPKAIEVYTTISQLLSRQRSGPLPKPFKILPSLPEHQLVSYLDLTSPESWTPYVHYMSVRLFISTKPHIAQPYLTRYLLPAVREQMHETKKLHAHLYSALKRALYKPACFFKGLLFPLLESETCTLREAHVISSAISRVSVPVLHSAAALLHLCEMGARMFTASARVEDRNDGPVNIFIRCLLEKKYALPYRVVDALVFHFVRFKAINSQGEGEDMEMNGAGSGVEGGASHYKLTVLWHQCLLAFAQRYRNDITEDQREALLDLVQARGHKLIGPEVRRELLEGRGRGVPADAAGGVVEGGDDTMVL